MAQAQAQAKLKKAKFPQLCTICNIVCSVVLVFPYIQIDHTS